MNVTLTPEIEAAVHRLVKTGRYASEADALAAAVRRLEEDERIVAAARRKIQDGADAADRGELHTLDEAVAILKRDHEEQFGPQDWGV